jgi:hypothetical protein
MLQRVIVLVAANLLAAGCAHYSYFSHGEMQLATGPEPALLSWGSDRSIHDTTLNLEICRFGLLQFSHVGADDGHVRLIARPALDRQVAKVGQDGGLNRLDTPLQPPVDCGLVLVEGSPAAVKQLSRGATPTVVILCERSEEASPYPPVADYRFGPIDRKRRWNLTGTRAAQPPALDCG